MDRGFLDTKSIGYWQVLVTDSRVGCCLADSSSIRAGYAAKEGPIPLQEYTFGTTEGKLSTSISSKTSFVIEASSIG